MKRNVTKEIKTIARERVGPVKPRKVEASKKRERLLRARSLDAAYDLS